MDEFSNDMLDGLASITADLDRLQAHVDLGRVRYAHDAGMQHELDVAQRDIDNHRKFVKDFTEAVKADSK